MQQHVEIDGETQKTLVEALFHRHAPAIFAFLRQQSSSREDAEDILLEVFTAVLEQKRLSTLPPDEQRSLLWRTTRNKLIDVHRRNMRRPSISMELMIDDLSADTEQAPEQELLRDEQVDALLQARGASARDQRMVHDLRSILENEDTGEDWYSLQRVFQKLVENDRPAHRQHGEIISLQQQERPVLMQKTIRLPHSARPIGRVFGTLAAALVAATLVGSMLFVFHAAPESSLHNWQPTNGNTDITTLRASWHHCQSGYHLPFKNASIGIADVRWSPNGADVAFSYSNGIAVFNAHTAALLESLPISQKNRAFQGLSWSPDGRYLATWSTEGVAQVLTLWNPATWQITRTYSGVVDFSWSPTGSLMAMAKDGRVQIVDTISGKTLRSFGGGNGIVSSVAWQPQGTQVLVGTYNVSSNMPHLSLWDTQTGTEVFAFKTFQGWSDGPSAWSADGKYVLMSALVGTSNVNLWNTTPTRSHASLYEVIWIA